MPKTEEWHLNLFKVRNQITSYHDAGTELTKKHNYWLHSTEMSS